MADDPIRVGTAGWSYEDWRGIVYPQTPPRGFDRLASMAALFDANEINSTFYRIPDARQTSDWVRRVAHNPRFVFTAKLYRGFTHERDAGPDEVKAFQSALEPIARDGRLGAVLVQYPFSFHDTPEARAELSRTLSLFRPHPLAVEFRHASWDRGETDRLLEEHGAAFVNIDQPSLERNLPASNRVTAPVAYYRFHGRNALQWFGPDTSNAQRYNYLYRDAELAPWIDRIREGAGAAARRAAPGVFVILNNHFRGQAVANALMLQKALTGQIRPVPEALLETYPELGGIASAAPEGGQRRLF